MPSHKRVRRRTVLAGLAGAVTAGCIGPRLSSPSEPSVSRTGDCGLLPSSRPDIWGWDHGGPSATASLPDGPSTPTEEVWSRDVEPSRGLVRAGSTLAVGTRDGVLALDTANGETVWTTDRESPIRVLATDGDAVYASRGRNDPLVALDAESGDERWRAGEATGVMLPLDGGVLADWDGSALAAGLDGATGDRCLSYSDGRGGNLAAAADGDRLYVSSIILSGDATDGSYVAGLDPSEESIVWRTEVTLAARVGLAVRDGTVYAVGGEQLHALSTTDGSTEWAVSHDFERGSPHPAVTDDRVFLRDDDWLIAYDAATGEERWRALEGSFPEGDADPVVAGDTVYLPPGDYGGLAGIDVASGDRVETTPRAVSAVAPGPDALYATERHAVARFE